MYSLGLLTLPSLYASFALHAGEPAVGVKEMIFGVPYVVAGLVFALVSVRQSAVVVGWYPIFCFVVDAVIGSYVLWLSRRVPDANLRKA